MGKYKKHHKCGCDDDHSHSDDYDMMKPFKKIMKGKKL
tara:strand:+ start:86 stop:199 length:114 start_codon:yes stop_codon:yes gene_type:complete